MDELLGKARDVIGRGGLPEEDSLPNKLSREAALFDGLVNNAIEVGKQYVKNAPEELANTAIVSLFIGGALAAVTKNPGLLGKAATPILRGAGEYAPTVLGGMFAADVTTRVGAPIIKAWRSPAELEEAKKDLAVNVGTGVVDFGVGLAAGSAGLAAAWKATPAWVNKSPTFDLRPSLKLGEPVTEAQNPKSFITRQEDHVASDVISLYEKSFPKEERQPVAEVEELVKSGRIVVHTTRDANNNLNAFSFVSKHDETAFKFGNLDFIATDPGQYSQGIGSLHARRLNELFKEDNPEFKGLTLEVESPEEAGLAADVLLTRQRRAKFYDRLDAPRTGVEYKILDFEDPAYRGPADWRVWQYKPDFDAVRAARLMMTDEGGYGLKVNTKQVREFDRANNFWEPTKDRVAVVPLTTAATVNAMDQLFGSQKMKGQDQPKLSQIRGPFDLHEKFHANR